MKKRYIIYSVSLEMPMLRDKIYPGCTLGRDDGVKRENIRVFDNQEDAKAALSKLASCVYPRFECRKAYYEVKEWRMDEEDIDDNGKSIRSVNIACAKIDSSYLEDENDYMP